MPIMFRSTNGHAPLVDFREALLAGQAPDRGLYLPTEIPRLAPEGWQALAGAPYVDVARRMLAPFLEPSIAERDLVAMLEEAYDFPVPLEPAGPRRFVLRLDRGPTLSFKDFAARLMARMMSYALRGEDHGLCVLAATSGDTGGAVANAFLGVEGIRVIVLFPLAEITKRQRLQMTTLGGSIAAVGIEGKFDDCQRLVKEAFADPDLAGFHLTSANSINFGRLLPQAVYYAYTYATLAGQGAIAPLEPIVFAVPCGNFGNLIGGALAQRMGLPVKKFVAGTNENDAFPRYLATGIYEKVEPSRRCISSAMNVGHPSNLSRLIDLYDGTLDHAGTLVRQADLARLRADVESVSVDDATCRRAMREAFRELGLILEPHGAVAWQALETLRPRREPAFRDEVQVAIETAHPAKFPEEVLAATGSDVPVPEALAVLERRREEFALMGPTYAELKQYLREELSHG